MNKNEKGKKIVKGTKKGSNVQYPCTPVMN